MKTIYVCITHEEPTGVTTKRDIITKDVRAAVEFIQNETREDDHE